MKVYNTLTRKKEELIMPLSQKPEPIPSAKGTSNLKKGVCRSIDINTQD